MGGLFTEHPITYSLLIIASLFRFSHPVCVWFSKREQCDLDDIAINAIICVNWLHYCTIECTFSYNQAATYLNCIPTWLIGASLLISIYASDSHNCIVFIEYFSLITKVKTRCDKSFPLTIWVILLYLANWVQIDDACVQWWIRISHLVPFHLSNVFIAPSILIFPNSLNVVYKRSICNRDMTIWFSGTYIKSSTFTHIGLIFWYGEGFYTDTSYRISK